MFAQAADDKQDALDSLVRDPYSLLRQSDCNRKHLQKDGWGVAWLAANSSWSMTKSEQAVYLENKKFAAAAQRARSRIIIAHIRHASNPKKLNRSELVRPENTQPFRWKNLVFAHNGTLNVADEIEGSLGRFQTFLKGTNDSESLFWLFAKCWSETRSGQDSLSRWRSAFSRTVREIETAWSRIPRRRRRFKRPFRGLNCMASDGKTLAALCYYEKPEGLSLCGQKRPYFQICYNVSQGRGTAASEPMTADKSWRALPNRTLLVLEPGAAHRTARLL